MWEILNGNWPNRFAITTDPPKNLKIISTPHMSHCELFELDQIKFRSPKFNNYSIFICWNKQIGPTN